MARIVILGAGIAGHTAALHLRRWLPRQHEVTVVSPNADWNWIPSNIWVGVGRMDAKKVLIPLRPIYRRKGIVFHQGLATTIRPEGTEENPAPSVEFTYTDDEHRGQTGSLNYDYLINATGPLLNFAATPGLGPDGHSWSVCTAEHAVEAAAFGGTVFYFGVPDDDSYPISMRTMLRNNLTLKSGVTLDRQRVLRRADDFAREHPDLLPAYVTHTFGSDDVPAAFELACRPMPERVKIAITR